MFKLAEYAPRVLEHDEDVRFKPRAACPVDDLLIEASDASHFHQSKARKRVSWSEDDGKLKSEFLAQKAACSQLPERAFKLWLVVSDSERAATLYRTLPPELNDCAGVVHFPECRNSSGLLELHPPALERFRSLFGGANPSLDDLKALAKLLYGCWMDEPADEDGFRRVQPMLRKAIDFRPPPIRHRWSRPDDRWPRAAVVLAGVEGFRCSVESGYFCWSFRDADSGVLPYPCESKRFSQFLDRILSAAAPARFSDIEEWLV